jgi:hypothetical protein
LRTFPVVVDAFPRGEKSETVKNSWKIASPS